MLRSRNDAAVAIAHYIGGSIDVVSLNMNETAKSIGAYNTNFVKSAMDCPQKTTTPQHMI